MNVAAQLHLMSREHHFEDVVRGDGGSKANGAQTGVAGCGALCAASATQQSAARDSARPHETTEPAATTRVPAGSSDVTPFLTTARGRRQRKKQAAVARDGTAAVKSVAGAGCEQTSFSAEKQGMASGCGANCSAVPDGGLDVLARAVLLVAGMAIPEHDRAAVLGRVVAAMIPPRKDS